MTFNPGAAVANTYQRDRIAHWDRVAHNLPDVRFAQETVTAIDPHTRRVTTSAASYDADFLVVALGADYDFAATPGLRAGHDEFYSVEGACNLRERLPAFVRGRVVIGICGVANTGVTLQKKKPPGGGWLILFKLQL